MCVYVFAVECMYVHACVRMYMNMCARIHRYVCVHVWTFVVCNCLRARIVLRPSSRAHYWHNVTLDYINVFLYNGCHDARMVCIIQRIEIIQNMSERQNDINLL
jgi:hypothetical protein